MYSGTSLLRPSELQTPPLYGRLTTVPTAVGHRNMYLLDLRIKDTSLFRNTDVCSAPKRVLTIVIELHTTDRRPHPTSLFNPRASYRWLVNQLLGRLVSNLGYHAYKDIWEPENGEMLELKRERENCKDINILLVC